MKIIRDFTDYSSHSPLALSLGMFDGVHLGHLSIIRQLNEIAEKEHRKRMVQFAIDKIPHFKISNIEYKCAEFPVF